MQAVLGDFNGDLGQLGDLVASGLAGHLALAFVKAVPAAAASRPVVHHPIDRLGWQQLAPLALMSGLGALRPPGGIGPLSLRRTWWVLARWRRGVTRVAIQALLELGDPLLVSGGLLGDLLAQLLDLFVHSQQHRDDRLAALLVDRLGLGALHV